MTATPHAEPTALPVLHRAARWYAARGWPVFPCWWRTESGACACGGTCSKPAKHPLGKIVHHGHRDAATDPAVIDRWWSRYPGANVGLPAVRFCVLDEDPRDGGDETRRDLEQKHGELPETVRAITGSGGAHYLFQPVDGLSNWQKRDDLPGLDLRAGGNGYIVAAPSVHPSGRRYQWEADHGPHEIALAPMPSWLLNLALGRTTTGEERPARPASEWAAMVDAPVTDGRRHPTLCSLAGMLAARGVPFEAGRALLLGFNARSCRPPKPEEEVRKVTVWAWQREMRRRAER